MTGHEHPASAGPATDARRQLQQIADLVDEYAELAEPHGNAHLMILLFQIRSVLGDDPAQAGQRISGERTPPS